MHAAGVSRRVHDSSEASHGGDAQVLVRVRRAAGCFSRRERWKGFILYTVYFVVYLVACHLQIDWVFGGSTVDLYRRARDSQAGISAVDDPWCDKATGYSVHTGEPCWWKFSEMETLDDLIGFVGNKISHFAQGMNTVCPACLVGITPSSHDMHGLSLADFSCSDFNLERGSASYPERDCAAADATWVARPSAITAPCCKNGTLVRASIMMMALEEVNRTTEASLALLLAEDRSTLQSLREAINRHLTTDQHFMQVIISRAERMTGINYLAQMEDPKWAPGRVTATKSYWTRRFDLFGTMQALWVLIWFFGLFSVFHDFIEFWSSRPTGASISKGLTQPYTWLLFSSILLPAVVSVTNMNISASAWPLLVSVSQLVMLARFIVEGEVVPACKVLLRTMAIATQQLVALGAVLAVLILVLAGVYGQLFGAFMYGDYGAVFLDLVAQFASGAVLDEEAELYSPIGSKLCYFVTMFVLFLTLSQVFITVLMDAFEAARERDAAAELETAVPDGYATVRDPIPLYQSLCNIAVGSAVYYLPLYGAWGPRLVRGLQIAIQEAEAADPTQAKRPLLVTRGALAEALQKAGVGEQALDRLVIKFGARPIPDVAAAPEEVADLRGHVFAKARLVGEPIPYADLENMSRATLQLVSRSLASGSGDWPGTGDLGRADHCVKQPLRAGASPETFGDSIVNIDRSLGHIHSILHSAQRRKREKRTLVALTDTRSCADRDL